AVVIIIGLVVGVTSKQVSYIQSHGGTGYHVVPGERTGNLYINADGSDDFYVAFSSDFSVPQSILSAPGSISFIARSDTSSLDPAFDAPDGTTVNDAHKIEKIVFEDNNGKVQGTYTTAEYNANPNGASINNWPAGLGVMGLGVLLAVLGLFVSRRKQPQGFSMAPVGGVQQPMYGAPAATPYGQPAPNPYGQPYPGAAPMGQPAPNPYGQPYPGQPAPNPYGQPYPGQPAPNPYGQPYPGQAGQPGANPYPPYQQPPQR
ncbi:MAG: hypothetical protein ACRDHW_13065, partial [Ktedonobacteraceae bacterium]